MDKENDYVLNLESFYQRFTSHMKASGERYSSYLSRFFNDLAIINKGYIQYKIEADKFISSDFNIFNYLKVDENSLSRYIGMLFDKQGEHGQQNLFLKIFIEYTNSYGITIPNKDYDIHREYQADGRIDIFLHSGETAIIIENKPYAADQKNQLSRYYGDIKNGFNGFKDVFIIYLSLGNEPSEYSIRADQLRSLKEEGKFLTIALYDFGEEYLRKCIQLCESQKFRFFLSDFKLFLETEFKPSEETQHGNN